MRKDNDGNVGEGRFALEASTNGESVRSGENEVEEYEVGLLGLGKPESALSVGGKEDAVAGVLEDVLDEGAEERIVVDAEDPDAVGVRVSRRLGIWRERVLNGKAAGGAADNGGGAGRGGEGLLEGVGSGGSSGAEV